MIRIQVWSTVGVTSCSIQYVPLPPARGKKAAPVEYLSYVQGPPLAHSEDHMLADLVEDAVQAAHQRATEMGGWSLLT